MNRRTPGNNEAAAVPHRYHTAGNQKRSPSSRHCIKPEEVTVFAISLHLRELFSVSRLVLAASVHFSRSAFCPPRSVPSRSATQRPVLRVPAFRTSAVRVSCGVVAEEPRPVGNRKGAGRPACRPPSTFACGSGHFPQKGNMCRGWFALSLRRALSPPDSPVHLRCRGRRIRRWVRRGGECRCARRGWGLRRSPRRRRSRQCTRR